MTVTSDEIIARAKEVLERDGWCQHRAHASDGTHCAMGALAQAMDELIPPHRLVGDWTAGANRTTYTSTTEWKEYNKRNAERESLYSQAHVKIMAQVKKDFSDHWAHIPMWNDEPGRTQEDVMLTFKKALEDG